MLLIVLMLFSTGFLSGCIEQSSTEQETPSITFMKDDLDDSITIASAESFVSWSAIEISGTCDTTNLDGYVEAADKIIDCIDKITITYIPTNTTLFTWDFASESSGLNNEKDTSLPEPQIVDYKAFYSGDGLYKVTGVIKNVASVDVNDVHIKIYIYDAGSNLIKSVSIDTKPSIIEAGEDAFFYETIYAEYCDSFDMEVVSYKKSDSSSYGDIQFLNLKIESETYDSIGNAFYKVEGDIKNAGSKILKNVRVWGMFYDSWGNILDMGFSFTKDVIYSGQMKSFKVGLMFWTSEFEVEDISRYELKAEYE